MLLYKRYNGWYLLPLLLASLLLCGCKKGYTPPTDSRVYAKNYQNFWLWGSMPASKFATPPHQLYILQGEIGWSALKQQSILQPQGMGLSHLPAKKIWLVYRTTHLRWSKQNVQAIIERLESWQRQGNQVAGVQVDFDAATRHLDSYALFLQQLRQQLPAHYQLGATGLLDWVNHSQPQTFLRLKGSVNEIVLQTYQGKSTIANYQHYMQQLAQLKIPFRIGLVEHGEWQADPAVESSPYFQGYVVFLLSDSPSKP